MNDDKELKSLLAFWTRHNITSSLMIHGIPDQKISEYIARMPKSDTEKTKKMILKEEPKLNKEQVQHRLALLFGKRINSMHNEKWHKHKEALKDMPSYLILQKASEIVFYYAHEKKPTVISMSDDTDDFNIMWTQMDQMGVDLQVLSTIDKALKTVRDFGTEDASS